MKKLSTKEGFTIVEVIVTILLIAVVSTILLYLFTDSFKNIIHSGQKDEAISRNSNILDVVYSLTTSDTIDEIKVISDSANNPYITDLEYVTDCSNLNNNPNNVKSRYCVEKVNNSEGDTVGFNVSVITFYLNGERKVEHTSFVRKKG